MANVVIRRRARADLDDQAEEMMADGFESAMRFLDAVEETFALLGKRPFTGVRTEHLPSSGLVTRFLPVTGFEKHLVFYRPLADGIDVVRVIRQAI